MKNEAQKYLTLIFILLICFLVEAEVNSAQTANKLVARAKTSIDKNQLAAAVTDSTAAIKLDANN